MNRKAFTLIELLVVVAIIGILAAVGVVAYNGYTTAAKANVIKTNFSNIKNYVLGEKFKCEAGVEKAFNNSFSCSGNSFKDGKTLAYRVEKYFKDKIKNPYGNFNITNGGGYDADNEVGIIRVLGFAGPERYRMRTCFKTSCKDISNHLKFDLNLY